MDFVPGVPEDEAVFFDGNVRTVIRNGQRVVISEEEYCRMNPFHKDTDCKECNFVGDKEDILLYHVSRELRENIGDEPIFVGKFCEPIMTGHQPYFLFRCGFCNHVSVNCISGRRRLFCRNCKEQTRLDPAKYQDILSLSSEDLKHYQEQDRFYKKLERRPLYRRLVSRGLLILGAYVIFRILS